MMSNVTYKKLGEVADTFRGLTYAKGDEVPYSSKGVLRSNNIDLETRALNFDEIKYLREDFEIPENRKIKKNSIFICMSNGSMQHLGKVAFVEKEYDYAFGGFMGLIVPHTSINPKYVYYCLTASNFLHQVLRSGHGANINNLKFSDIENYSIPVPSTEIQQRVVLQLDAIHAIRSEKKEQLRELDALAKAVFYDMFGDPALNDKGWNMLTIREVFPFIKNGANIKQTKGADGLPITRIETLSGGKFNRDRLGYANIYDTEKYAPYYLETGDILMSHINGKAYLGRAVMYTKVGEEQIIHGMNLLRLKANKDIVNPCFATYYFMTDDFKAKIVSIRKDAVNQSSFSTTDLSKLSFPLPPLDLQQAFASKISAIEQQKELIRASIAETEALLAARMQHYFD